MRIETMQLRPSGLVGSRTKWVVEGWEHADWIEEAVAKTFVAQGWFCGASYWPILNALLLSMRFDRFLSTDMVHKEIAKSILLEGIKSAASAAADRDTRNRLFARTQSVQAVENGDYEEQDATLEVIIMEMRGRSREEVSGNLQKAIRAAFQHADHRRRGARLSKVGPAQHADFALGKPLEGKDLAEACMMIFDIIGADGIMDIYLARSLRKAVAHKLNGWPDLMRFNAESFSFVEVKSPNDKPSAAQIEVARELIAAGIDVVELRVTPKA